MVMQIACVLAPVISQGGKFRPQFPALQSNEGLSGALLDLPLIGDALGDDPEDLRFEAFVGFARIPGQSPLGLCIVYAQADSARLDTADAAAAYHVFWRWTITRAEKPTGDTEKSPYKPPVNAELIAVRDYLALQTGKSATVITAWLAQQFEVTPAQAVAWATARPRHRTIVKLGQAFRDWNTAKAQLDALG